MEQRKCFESEGIRGLSFDVQQSSEVPGEGRRERRMMGRLEIHGKLAERSVSVFLGRLFVYPRENMKLIKGVCTVQERVLV